MTPAEQIDELLAKCPPDIAKLGRACLAKLRKRLPHAVEMVYYYANQNSVVFSFGATENGSEGIFSLKLAPDAVSFYLTWVKGLPDPEKRLRGSAKTVRYVELESPATLDDPYVVKLMDAALAGAKVPFDPKAKHRLVIKSNAGK